VRLPVFTSLQGYRPRWLRGDAVAGLTVWAVLVPEALAYASIAGCPRWSACTRRQAR
jgi:MFS superfamily sulfate permease-like transporter